MTKQRTGDELIVFDNMPIGKSLSDYWRWNASDLLNNTLRGSYCEFIVSAALGVDLSGTNDDWTPYDISFPYNWYVMASPAIKCASRSRVAHIFRHGGRAMEDCPASSSASGQRELGTPSAAMPRRLSGNLTCMCSASIRRPCASVPTRWYWMDGISTSYRLIFWTSSAALRRPSRLLCCKSWTHTLQTMAASVMPLSIP
mgnify:CR=1 FL=1